MTPPPIIISRTVDLKENHLDSKHFSSMLGTIKTIPLMEYCLESQEHCLTWAIRPTSKIGHHHRCDLGQECSHLEWLEFRKAS